MLEGAEVRLAVDIGGTFTDIVLDVGQDRKTRKLLTTPQRPDLGLHTGAQPRVGAGEDRVADTGHLGLRLGRTTLDRSPRDRPAQLRPWPIA